MYFYPQIMLEIVVECLVLLDCRLLHCMYIYVYIRVPFIVYIYCTLLPTKHVCILKSHLDTLRSLYRYFFIKKSYSCH